MRAIVTIEGPDGTIVDLHPGDLIGRMQRAALCLDDPKVSEAHALVSMRGGTLKLLALRGALAVDRRRRSEVDLEPGQVIHLAQGQSLCVLNVVLPKELMALRLNGGRPIVLSGSVLSVLGGEAPTLLSRFDGAAAAHLWSTGTGWRARVAGGKAIDVTVGMALDLPDIDARFESVEVQVAALPTTVGEGRVHLPLKIVARYHSAHLHRRGLPVVSLSGQPAMLLSELVSFDGPVAWDLLAKQVWRRLSNRDALRKKLDAALLRLRKKLRDAGIREDLIRADGTGQFELVLYDGDQVEDLT